MNELIGLLVIGIFLFIYMILSSIELGSSLFFSLPHLLQDKSIIKKYMGPVWEATSVFLVFALICLFTFFPGAVPMLSTSLFPLVSIGLIFMIIRIIAVLCIFYAEYENPFIHFLLIIGSFLSPMFFSSAFVVMMTGANSPSHIWLSPMMVSIELLVAMSMIIISSSFFLYFERSKVENVALGRFLDWSIIVWLLAVGFFFVAINNQAIYLLNESDKVVDLALYTAFSVILFICTRFVKHYLLSFVTACLLIALLFFSIVWLHFPYLVYPNITIYSAFTDPTTFHGMVIGLIVGAIIVLPALWLMHSLFTFAKQEK